MENVPRGKSLVLEKVVEIETTHEFFHKLNIYFHFVAPDCKFVHLENLRAHGIFIFNGKCQQNTLEILYLTENFSGHSSFFIYREFRKIFIFNRKFGAR